MAPTSQHNNNNNNSQRIPLKADKIVWITTRNTQTQGGTSATHISVPADHDLGMPKDESMLQQTAFKR